MLSQSKLQSIILTSRLAESEELYRGVFGLTLKGKSDGALVFDVGGSDLRVAPIPSFEPSDYTLLGFSVPDVDSSVS